MCEHVVYNEYRYARQRPQPPDLRTTQPLTPSKKE